MVTADRADRLTPAPSTIARWCGARLWILPALWAIGYLWPPLNHDVAAMLQFAQRIADGERLYVDLIDINPPMMFWLDLIPVGLARLTGLPVPSAFIVTVLAATAASGALAWRLFRALPEAADPLGAVLLPGLALLAMLVLPTHNFGQREHLLLILTLPYLTLAAARLAGRPQPAGLSLGVGVLAALGIGMKPHFALLPVAVELVLLLPPGRWRRLRDPSPWAIVAIGAAYLAATLVWLPEYVGVMVPLVARYYHAFDPAAVLALAAQPEMLTLIGAWVALAAATAWRGGVIARVAAAAVGGALLAGLLQAKPWDYHYVAAVGLMYLLAGVLVVDIVGRRVRLGAAPALAAGLLVGMAAWSGALSPPFAAQLAFRDSPAGRLLPIVRAEAGGQPVLWLTASIYPQFPVLNEAGSRMAMRFMSLWLLPAIYGEGPARPTAAPYNDPAAMEPAETLVYRSVIDDFLRLRPALVLVQDAERDGGFNGRPFDYLEYFRRDPAFARAWTGYRLLTRVDGVRIFKRG